MRVVFAVGVDLVASGGQGDHDDGCHAADAGCGEKRRGDATEEGVLGPVDDLLRPGAEDTRGDALDEGDAACGVRAELFGEAEGAEHPTMPLSVRSIRPCRC